MIVGGWAPMGVQPHLCKENIMKFLVQLQDEFPAEMTEEEFREWLDMFMADKSMGATFKVVRKYR
ncbi:hypothetical protein SEA_ZHENGYI_15 [Microbacterium phage Zhengyi]|nr:hypothetical protein SEA_ZHENGYI_15 [Microbacterium phage Zhengyi]